MIRIAIDVMGGDHCPDVNLDGAYDALSSGEGFGVLLVGPEALIRERISDWDQALRDRAKIIDAKDVITTEEQPVRALRSGADSTIVKGLRLVKEAQADAFVSAGSSGALLAGGQLIVGRIRGVLRTPLASMMPTEKGFSLFLDCGANVDAKPEWLVQYALMGDIYMRLVEGRDNAVIKLANVGPEEEKGNALVKAAHAILKNTPGINYQGFIEFRDIPHGGADIVVADAFTGNSIIKTYEGVASVMMDTVKGALTRSLKTKLGALLIMKDLKDSFREYDVSRCGGAMLLGLNGVVIKCHGNADRREVQTSVEKAFRFASLDVKGRIGEAVRCDLQLDQSARFN